MKLAPMSMVGMAIGVGLSCLLAGDAATVGVFGRGAASPVLQGPAWSEVKWPFLLDQWGTGRAFRCGAERCGTQVHVYLRAKVGFCNCTAGVFDDDEIDRVGDLDLIGARYAARAPGRPVTVGMLKGRARPFSVERALRPPVSALAVALANKCDAVVATVVTEPDMEPAHEGAAIEFLETEMVQRWAEANTGLQ